MIFIKNLTKINEEKYSIGYTHCAPFDSECGLRKTKEELEQEGVLVESIPKPQQIEGKISIMYWNPVNKKIFYEYEESKEKTEKETFTKTLAQLTVENKKKDVMIVQLVQQVNTLNIEINKMKEGNK